MKKVLIFAGVALLLFALIAQPENAASWVRSIVVALGHGAQALITFVRNLFTR
jgi:hypothetical protein